MKKVLITAIESFTWVHLSKYLIKSGYELLNESLSYKLSNHYSASKYSMEILTRNYFYYLLKSIHKNKYESS